MDSKNIKEVVSEVAHHVQPSRIKDFVIAILLVVIMKLLFFLLLCMIGYNPKMGKLAIFD